LKTADFDYDLPIERIAQIPVEPRHASRLLVLDRGQAELQHTHFWQIGDYIQPGDLLVVNQTRVIPARIFGRKPTGGRVELLLLRRMDPQIWEVLVGGKRIGVGSKLSLEAGPDAEIIDVLEGSRRLVRFSEPVEEYLERAGEMPLPPYIHTHLADPARYQTVYAAENGSAAAPTAGLHFTPELINSLKEKGVRFGTVTLHVGLDTFAPVTEEDAETHHIHSEWCELNQSTADQINAAHDAGHKVIAVGTTSVRTLETAGLAAEKQNLKGAVPVSGPTSLFILPGHQFRTVDAMITNFHLPRSSLIMLVSAFAGRERVLSAYREAIRLEYRFYSFGDAMLIL